TYLQVENIRRVNLNALKGFTCDNYNLLRDLAHVEALTVPLKEKKSGPVPIEALENLQRLSSTLNAPSEAVDLTCLPRLRSCALTWNTGMRSVFDCAALERLYLTGLKAPDADALSALRSLKSLQLAHTSMTSLAPIAGTSTLERLDLKVARQLESIEAVAGLPKLLCLYIAEAHKITSLEPVRHLKNLEALILVDCGEIDSLAPLADLIALKAVCFSGAKTTIKDGDLSPLTQLPNLGMLMFGARRHYSHKLTKKWSWDNFNTPDALLKAA
ncbi:MAG: hypothetical protein HKN05_23295, partial [Rhizobiales bacterium]|nr:hypothetical protein [Hyphomicrobiales bacterium]